MKTYDFDTALLITRLNADRGQRVWRLVETGPELFHPWVSDGLGDGPSALEPSAAEVLTLPQFVVYPSGLWLHVSRVLWLWHVKEESRYRLGNAEQADRFARGRGFVSPICVPPEFVHGVLVDEGDRMVPGVSFPHWCGV